HALGRALGWDRPTSAWIEDMGVAHALPLEEARVVARGHDRLSLARAGRLLIGEDVADALFGVLGILHADAPGLVALLPADLRVAAGLDDVIVEPAREQQCGRAVDRVALG